MATAGGGSPPEPLCTLRGSDAAVTAVRYWRAGTTLLAGTDLGSVYVWHVAERRHRHRLARLHQGKSVLWLYGVPGTTRQVLSQGRDETLRIVTLDAAASQPPTTELLYTQCGYGFCQADWLGRLDDELTSCVCLPQTGEESSIVVYDLNSRREVRHVSVDASYGMLMCMKCISIDSSSDRMVLCGCEAGQIALFSLMESKEMNNFKLFEDAVFSVEFDVASSQGVAGSAGDSLKVFHLSREGAITVVKQVTITNPGISQLRLRKCDGRLLASAGWDHRIRLFSWTKLKPLAVLSYHKGTVNCIDFADNDEFACGSKDKTISIWNVYAQ